MSAPLSGDDHDDSSVSRGRSSDRRWRRIAWTLVRLMILIVMVWGIGRTIEQTREEFAERGFAWGQVGLGWLGAAMGLYALGTLPAAIYWWQLLKALGQPAPLWGSVRAYVVGGLGKYVPGKALVVVVRSQLLRAAGVDWRIAALSVFAETFTLMAVGGLLGGLLIALAFRQQSRLLISIIPVAIAFGLPTCPPVLRWILGWIGRRRGMTWELGQLEALNWRFLGRAWLLLAIGWGIWGLSLWCAVQALPPSAGPPPTGPLLGFLREWGLMTAAVSLAVVAGFVLQMPAGIGAREWVIVELLKPVYGGAVGLLAAALLRGAWLVSECAVSIILYLAVCPDRVRTPPAPHEEQLGG